MLRRKSASGVSSFDRKFVEVLEPRRLLSAATSGVVEYDPIAGKEYAVPADRFATADRALEESLRSEGFEGIDDLIASLGSPRDFQAKLDGQLEGGTGSPREGGGQESVFGTDSRTQITATTSFPWRSIGLINTGGSGAMISPYHVLTAGHVVHSGGPGGSWFTDVQVSMGQNGNERFYGTANATWMRTYNAWVNSSDWNWDWALITLDRNIGNTTGWMGREWNSGTNFYNGTTMNTAGYPGDKPFGTMWYASGPVGTSTANHFYYNGTMDTAPGQSGSPVWKLDGTNRYITAVHAYGDGGDGYNKAVRLTSGKDTDTNNWITEDNGLRAPTDRADLVDYDQWFTTASAFMSNSTRYPGQSMSVTSYPRNNGTANSGNYTVSFYASTNTTISSADYPLGTVSMGSLAPFNWATATASFNVPQDIPAGQYYVGWVIDSGNGVTEYLENNNTGYITGQSLTVASIPADALEPNDTLANARYLGSFGSYSRGGLSIHAGANNDYFSFIAGSNATATITASFTHAEGDIDLQLLDSSGVVLQSSTGTANNETISRALSVGQLYYLRVYGYNNQVNYNYGLSISQPDSLAPVASIAAVTPNPRTAPLGGVITTFTEPVSGVGLSDFTLTRNDGGNLLNPSAHLLLSYDNGASYSISGLNGVTTLPGVYRLRLNHTGSGIADSSSNALGASVERTFRVYKVGDMNGDGAVNNLDIAPFALALTSPAGFSSSFPYVDRVLSGDVNLDGVLNNLDIASFVALLTGARGTAPAPLNPPEQNASVFADRILGDVLGFDADPVNGGEIALLV